MGLKKIYFERANVMVQSVFRTFSLIMLTGESVENIFNLSI